MNLRRVMTSFAVAGLVTSGAAVVAPAGASASTAQCGAGNACIWGENSYTGLVKGFTGSQAAFTSWNGSTVSAGNGANSIFNRSGCTTYWYDYTNYGGHGKVFNTESTGFNYIDPDLGNGGGTGIAGGYSSEPFANRIESVKFCTAA